MKLILLICFTCFFQQQVLSQSEYLVRSTTGSSGASTILKNGSDTYTVQESVGQSSVIGTFSEDNYVLRQGFIQPNILSKISDKNIPMGLNLTLYPNPFDKQISLLFEEDVIGEVNVSVFDVSGRLLRRRQYSPNQKLNVDLEDLPSGSYLFKVVANAKQFITKIIRK